ncbi:ABC transporter permease [Pseudonocardia sp. NPDC046786]|uniref:ABC transporter permease n=1 Tax=Pseudonocardia sp. NPDC046786 TaxID=3155471 RepID=UPI0033E10F83
MSAPARPGAGRFPQPGPTVDRPARTRRRTAAPLSRLLRSEIELALARPRTAVALAAAALVPILGATALAASGPERYAYVLGVLMVALAEPAAFSLGMPVVLVAADAFATERARGTLDGLRLSPVGSGRLVLLKASAVAAAAVLASVVVVGTSLLAGWAALGAGPFGTGPTLARALLLTVWTAGQLTGFGVLLLAVSAAARRPSVVVVAGLVALVVAPLVAVLWGPAAPALPTGHWHEVLAGTFSAPVDTAAAWATTLRAAGFAVAGAGVAGYLLGRGS